MINISNLNFVYNNSKKHAVKDVAFGIEKGEVFGFLGLVLRKTTHSV